MSRALLPALALLVGCNSDLVYDGAFVLPSAADITAPGQVTPFDETVAYVASRTGGQIRGLGAESGRFLSDDATASFLRGSPLSTGQRRALVSLAIWSPTPEQLTVFAVDESFDVLLEVPHVTGVEDGVPVEPVVQVSEVTASGGGSLTELDVHDGFAASETWTLTWDGSAWRASGTRSGQLDGRIDPGISYTPLSQAFTLTATAGSSAGDTLSFTTDSGLVEHDLGAAPIAVSTAPTQDLLAVIVQDATSDSGSVLWFDPASAAIVGEVALPDGRRPTALAWEGETLWIADAAVSLGGPDGGETGAALWSVPAGETEPTRFDIAAPASVIEPVPDAGRLYYVHVGEFDLRAISLDSGQIIDLDPVRPDSTGFPFHGVIRGLAMLPGSFEQIDDNDDLEFRTATDVIAVSLFRGTVVFYDPATGCALQDGFGPRTTAIGRSTGVSAGDYEYDFDGESNGPTLNLNGPNANHIVVNGCAGIARSEGWRLVFDDIELGWRVEGELSGVQSELAYEGVRYVSDDGAISFRLEPGTTPSRAGWTIQFTVTDGMMGITGDQDDDGLVSPVNNEFDWRAPGVPLPVVLPAAGSRAEPTPAVIVPLEGSDRVARGRPESGLTDAVWE